MRFRAEADPLDGFARGLEEDLARTVTAAMEDAGRQLQQALRDETQGAFKGNRLPKTWRLRRYPAGGASIDAAAFVWTKAPVLIDAFSRGVTIRAQGGKWLAIPTDAAGKSGLRRGANGFGVTVNTRGARERVTPGGFERRTGMKLRFVYDGPRRAFLVVDAAARNAKTGVARPYSPRGRGSKLYGPAGQTVVVFILVPQVRLAKRLDPEAAAKRVADSLPALISKHWS